MKQTTDVSYDHGGLPYPVSMLSGILPSNWRRYTVPKGLTVLQWVADFSDRVKQLQKISHAANTGGAKGLKVCYYRTICLCWFLSGEVLGHQFQPYEGMTEIDNFA